MAIKYDGHRIVAVVDGHSEVKLISRTPLFRTVRRPVSCRREIVLDGEIAVPDDRGVTHIGHCQTRSMVASRIGPPVSRSTCFTSTGRDLWRNPIE